MLGNAQKQYNHLNLPTSVVFGSTGQIDYIYDATGIKLRKTVTQTTGGTNTTHYAGGYVYLNNTLQFIAQPEGYVDPVAQSSQVKGSSNGTTTYSAYNYIFQFKDHLGNIRLSYGDSDKNGAVDTSEIIEESHYYPFGLKQKGYNEDISANGNSVAQQWKYNGIQFNEDLDLNLYEMDMRQYDPAIGRWMVIDPITHHEFSPYNGMDNNPVIGADPLGSDTINHGGGTLFTEDEAIAAYKGLQNIYGGSETEDWKPVVNDDGSVDYVAEERDSEETFAQQYGVTVNQAKSLIGSRNVVAGETSVSGKSVSAMFGTKVLKLKLMSDLATDQRIIDQVIFAILNSALEGDDYWHTQDYFNDVLKVDQNYKQYRGKFDTGSGLIDIGMLLQWNASSGGFFGSDHPSVFKNYLNYKDNGQIGNIFTGSLSRKPIENIHFGSGIDFPDGIKWKANRWSSSQFVTQPGDGQTVINQVFKRFKNN